MTSPSRPGDQREPHPVPGSVGRQPDDVAVALDDRLGNALRDGESRLFGEVSVFQPWTGTVIAAAPTRTSSPIPAGQGAGYVHVRLFLGHDQGTEVGKLVHDRPIATSLPGMIRDEENHVSPIQLEFVACRTRSGRAPRAARPGRRWRQPALARGGRRMASSKRTGSGKSRKYPSPGQPSKAVERAAGDAHPAPGSRRDPPMVCSLAALDAKVVTSTSALGLGDLLPMPL